MTANKDRKTSAKAASGLFRSGALRTGLAAALLLTTSAAALHAQDRDLQRELDQLKAQINSLKAAINEQRVETRKNKEKIKLVADKSLTPIGPPPGYTKGGFQPIGGFDDKKLHFGGITITPGGFVAAEALFRSRASGADIATTFAGIPFPSAQLAHTNETKFSIRQSRLAMLVEANITPSILGAGYFEGDFNATGTSSNFTQTDSFVARVRNIYATLDFLDTGFHVLAGQNWSLITLNSKGITPRNEVLPPTIDSGVFPGADYARQPGIRITKDFDKKLWISVSAEQSATSYAGTGCSNVVSNTPSNALSVTGPVGALGSTLTSTGTLSGGVAPNALTTATNGINVTCLTTGGGGFGQTGQTQQISLNHIPDIFGKVAYEANLAGHDVHLEGLGVYRNFYDRTNYGTLLASGYSGPSINQNTSGYGVGGGIIAAIIPTKLDFQASGIIGRGIGRYTSSGLNDATINASGQVSPIREASFNGGFTFHANSAIDVYAFGGFDKVFADYSVSNKGAFLGYGIPTLSNAGCYIEGQSGTCAGLTGTVYDITVGFWDKIYQGPYGYFRAGAQYQYVNRKLLPGVGGAPSVGDNIVMTSLRYYPF